MKSKFSDYYLGLDIGTDSVGWAVTDEKYNVLQFNGKATWGIHLFDGGNTAEDRRAYRCARRRLERRKQRIALLRELFDSEICKVDQSFFNRMDESNLHPDDRTAKQESVLFCDADFTDKIFHKKYPTIYHLRKDLMDTVSKPDIRLLYIAIHHIIKHRGHFLFNEASGDGGLDFNTVFRELLQNLNDEHGFDLDADLELDQIREVILDDKLGILDKKRKLNSLIHGEGVNEKEFVTLLAGGKTQISKMFEDENLGELKKLALSDADFAEFMEEIEDDIGSERKYTLELCKQIFDWAVLTKILKGSMGISDAKKKEYDQHRNDLKWLKSAIRRYAPGKYGEVFRSAKTEHNYCAYVNEFGGRAPKVKTCSQEDFCRYIRSILQDKPIEDEVLSRLNENLFMPKQRTKSNSVIPYFIHKKELEIIIKNASKHYDFLNELDEYGTSVGEKIIKLLEFRIPYYVGPLDDRSDKAWIVRKNHTDKITPWNFDRLVDVDKTASGFIERLTSMCTYLIGEKVLPKNSLLYSEFELYNELNTLEIDGERINADIKNKIVKNLFENVNAVKKIKKKDIEKYLEAEGLLSPTRVLSGIDVEIKSNLRSMVQVKGVIGAKISNRELVEDVIKTITIFGDERSRVLKKLMGDHSHELTENEIRQLANLKFQGWGRLSEKFLTGISFIDKATHAPSSILTLLKQTNQNLQEILHKYGFIELIEKVNSKVGPEELNEISYEMVEQLYVSPAVKRSTWRTLNVVQDIVSAIGRPPKKIFVETTREKMESNRTLSRKEQLKLLFNSCKEEEWLKAVEAEDEGRLRQQNLFLYYIQHGKCMYCGNKIDLNDLNNTDAVDRDHIYPQSKIKDDSIHNNLALVCRTCNQNKGDKFPLPFEWQNKMGGKWSYLKDKGFITVEKYKRLTRKDEFSEDELSRFINRQLVDTSQSVKGVISVLKKTFKGVDLVYVKGKNVSEFRKKFVLSKCRAVNDFHHAKDAYLNIVVGNVYDTKFTKDSLKFIRSGEQYNVSKMYDRAVSRGSICAWTPGETLITVKKYMNRNNILFTRFSTENKGKMFDENPLKKKSSLFRSKDGRDPGKYGGYDNVKGAYFALIEHKNGKEIIRTLETVPIYLSKKNPSEQEMLVYFSEKEGLIDPKIVIEKVKIKSTFNINGFRCHISARTGNQVLFTNGMQLLLPYDLYDYCKIINKYAEDRKDRKDMPVNAYGFTAEMNNKLYEFFLEKSEGTVYKKALGPFVNNLVNVHETFMSSSIDIQARTLNQILKSFRCNPESTDLHEIGGVKTTGRILLNKRISREGSIKIINQSPSGLFENETDLWKI